MFFKMMTCAPLPSTLPAEISLTLPEPISNLLKSSTNEGFHFRHSVMQGSKIRSTKLEATISPELKTFYDLKINVTSDKRLEICTETVSQASNLIWKCERRKRISASRAHQIFRAKTKRMALKYFFEEKMENRNFIYGRETEPKAKECFQSVLNVHVFDCGLVIKKSQPWICASPDGVFLDDTGKTCLLEVKCPSSCVAKAISVPYLKDNQLKKNHPYYTQIQIQLYCCDLEKCFLFVYSSSDHKIIEVTKDVDFL
jgi:putative phage-type endonuclease